jgi:hypothetical protein
MNWIESQQPNGLIGKIEISPWTRSTHKYGRVRTAVYQPSTYTGEYIKKELAKVNEHMKAVAELLPAKGTLLEDDPICNLWRE